jgi:pimeloyl-ACP methyl ester carboxylesterase
MQEWMRSGAECGCRTETPLHDFFLAVVRHATVERFYTAGYERIELAGVGHFPHREQPTAFADLIARFVDA